MKAKQERREHYKKHVWECLNIWKHEMRNLAAVENKIRDWLARRVEAK